MEVSPVKEYGIFSLVSAFSASPGCAAPTSVHHNFPRMMTIEAGRAEQTLPPLLMSKQANLLREAFYGPTKSPLFVWPAIPDILQCIEALWHQPLKSEVSVSVLVCYPAPGDSLSRHTPLDDTLACPPDYSRHRGRWLAERKLFPLVHDREMLGYYDKIFKLGSQLTAVVNNLGVFGVSLDIAPSKAPLRCPPRFSALLSIRS